MAVTIARQACSAVSCLQRCAWSGSRWTELTRTSLRPSYVNLLTGRLLWSRAGSAGVGVEAVVLVMQREADYQPPRWSGESIAHLDLTAGDSLDKPEHGAIALGAQHVEPNPARGGGFCWIRLVTGSASPR